MKFQKHDRIADGVKAGEFRTFLRDCARREIEDLCDPALARFNREIVDELVADGWFEIDNGKLKATDKARRLRAANFIKRMSRAQADDLLAGLLDRAAIINATDDFLNRIEWLGVFGSYLTDAPDLGDLDVICDIKPTFADRGLDFTGAAIEGAYLRACAVTGTRPLQSYDPLGYFGKLARLTSQFLRNRQSRIQLHPLELEREVLTLTPVRTVFGTAPDFVTKA